MSKGARFTLEQAMSGLGPKAKAEIEAQLKIKTDDPIKDSCPPSYPEPKQALFYVPDSAPQREAYYTGRVAIRVTSFRRRLIDPDNLCPKYFVDGLRYAKIISGDSAGEVEILTTQTRVFTKEEERTEIEITPYL